MNISLFKKFKQYKHYTGAAVAAVVLMAGCGGGDGGGKSGNSPSAMRKLFDGAGGDAFVPSKEGMLLISTTQKTQRLGEEGRVHVTVKGVNKSGKDMSVTTITQQFKHYEDAIKTTENVVNVIDGVTEIDILGPFATSLELSSTATKNFDKMRLSSKMKPGEIFGDMKRDVMVMGEAGSVSITNIKCADIEEITVPAGTFKKAYKMTYNLNVRIEGKERTRVKERPFKVESYWEPGKNVTLSITEWYVKGIGAVKSESVVTEDDTGEADELNMTSELFLISDNDELAETCKKFRARFMELGYTDEHFADEIGDEYCNSDYFIAMVKEIKDAGKKVERYVDETVARNLGGISADNRDFAKIAKSKVPEARTQELARRAEAQAEAERRLAEEQAEMERRRAEEQAAQERRQAAQAAYRRGYAAENRFTYNPAHREAVLKSNPKLVDAYNEAIAEYTESIRLYPDDANVYNRRGTLYHNIKKNYDNAIKDYEQALRLDPNNVQVKKNLANSYNSRGNVYQDQEKDYNKAIKDYEQALRLDPNQPYAQKNLANARANLQQTQ